MWQHYLVISRWLISINYSVVMLKCYMPHIHRQIVHADLAIAAVCIDLNLTVGMMHDTSTLLTAKCCLKEPLIKTSPLSNYCLSPWYIAPSSSPSGDGDNRSGPWRVGGRRGSYRCHPATFRTVWTGQWGDTSAPTSRASDHHGNCHQPGHPAGERRIFPH